MNTIGENIIFWLYLEKKNGKAFLKRPLRGTVHEFIKTSYLIRHKNYISSIRGIYCEVLKNMKNSSFYVSAINEENIRIIQVSKGSRKKIKVLFFSGPTTKRGGVRARPLRKKGLFLKFFFYLWPWKKSS